MPRSRSSGSRSVSTPVSAPTSTVLPWSMCPAVPSVSGRAPAASAQLGRAPPRRAFTTKSSSTVARSCAGRAAAAPSWTRATTGGSPSREGARAARRRRRRRRRPRPPGPSSSSSGSAPPPARPAPRTIVTPAPVPPSSASPQALGARGQLLLAGGQHPQHRDARACRAAGSRCSRSVASSAASESLSIRTRARQRMRSQPLDRVAPPDDQPGLRAAEQLVAGEADDVRARRDAVARRGLVGSSAAELVVRCESTPEPRSSITGSSRAAPSSQSSAIPTSSVKPIVRKFEAWTRISARRVRADRAPRSRRARVRFVVPTSTSRAPDAARISGIRNEPPISTSCPREITTSRPCGQRRQRQQDGGGVVVHGERGLGARSARRAAPRRAPGGCRAHPRRGRTRGSSSRSRRRRSPRAPRTRAARGRGSCGSRPRSR